DRLRNHSKSINIQIPTTDPNTDPLRKYYIILDLGKLTIELRVLTHILLDCPFYRRERHALHLKLRCNASTIPFLLGNPAAVKHMLAFARSTGRFKEYEEPVDKLEMNARRTAELIAGARAL